MSVVIFSHGKQAKLSAAKMDTLEEVVKDFGYQSVSLDYTSTLNPDKRVKMLEEYLKEHPFEKIILAGSSMGGYVSAVLASKIPVEGLFMLSPAFYIQNYQVREFNLFTSKVEIIHGWKDDVVPFENSIRFGELHAARLHLIDDDHSLSNSHHFIKETFINFFNRLDRE